MKLYSSYFVFALISATAALSMALPANAAKEPVGVPGDRRIKQVMYNENQVYEIVGSYFTQTTIEFSPNEKILVISQGDSQAWKVKRSKSVRNVLFIKPTEDNAVANLTIVTDKRKYFFNLSVGKRNTPKTFLVRFTYPGNEIASFQDGASMDGLSVEKLNMSYGFSGDINAIGLKHAFDDGQFTFFQFDENAELPEVYVVGPDGTESLVNTRRQHNFYVAEMTGSLFTLRNGRSKLCVRNNARPYKRDSTPVARVGKGV